MDDIFKLIQKCDITQLIVMGAMLWFFYSRIDKKFEKIDQRFEKIDKRFEKIEKDIQDTRTSINRIEGMIYGRDNFWIHDHKEKVE